MADNKTENNDCIFYRLDTKYHTPDVSEKVAQVSDKSDRKRSKEHKGLLSKLFKRKSKLPTDVLSNIVWRLK
jgi:hypothetical protein